MSQPRPHPPNTRVHTPNSYFEILNLEKIFPQKGPLEVEIGCGDGSFLAAYAAENGATNFLGIERLLGRIRKLDRKAIRQDLKNLAILRVEASYAVERMLPAHSVDVYHCYFPDPWPKKRHWKKRLIAPAFLTTLANSMKPQGRIYLRTDHESYYEQMQESFEAHADRFEAIDTPDEISAIVTDFEQDFNAEGIPTLRLAYRIRAN